MDRDITSRPKVRRHRSDPKNPEESDPSHTIRDGTDRSDRKFEDRDMRADRTFLLLITAAAAAAAGVCA